MESGFFTLRDVLEVSAIPLTVILLAFLWPSIQARYRAKRFRKLMLVELGKLEPYPDYILPRGNWKTHVKENCLHKAILQNAAEIQHLILALCPKFVSTLSELWNAVETESDDQWFLHFQNLSEHRHLRPIKCVIDSNLNMWQTLIKEYREASGFGTRHLLNVKGKYYVTDRCKGCGFCEAVAPEHFEFDPNAGRSYVATQPTNLLAHNDVHWACLECPTGAIKEDGNEFDWSFQGERKVGYNTLSNYLASIKQDEHA